MSEKLIIDAKINATASRLKLQHGWWNMWLGLLIGVCLWLGCLLVYKLAPIPQAILLWSGILGLVLPLAGLSVGLSKRFVAVDTARWLDRETGLKERLSTAVEMSEFSAKKSSWSALVVRDAALAAGEIDPGKLLPLRLPKVCHWTVPVLAACVGLGFVPEHRTQTYLKQKRDSSIIEDVGQNLAALTKLQVETTPPNFKPTEESLKAVQELGLEFTQGKLVRDKALAKLSDVAEQLRAQAAKLGQERTLNKMHQVAATPSGAGQQSKAKMHRQLDELMESLGDAKEAKLDELNALKSKINAIMDTADALSEADAPEKEQGHRQLAQSMVDLANMAEQLGLEMPNLNEAVKGLESSNIDQFLKNMNIAKQDLQEIADLVKTMQNLQMQMAEIGKSLGEQLEKGQIPAAIESLQKMMDRLVSAQLTPDQLDKMIKELQQALTPAEGFGECSSHLSDAKGKAKAGDKAGASRSLAKAKEELGNTLQQLGDMQNMMAALQNLERAQLAVGNCQSFGSTQKPRVGPNSKAGVGVGTWGNDNYQLLPEDLAQGWDNSGFARPDMDARGNTDRGDGKVPDDMVSTRVKGKINPNGPMPSITLRGVSIKGYSRIQFQETVSAAQSDAHNALNQDKVPRPYRDSVRNYFDDL